MKEHADILELASILKSAAMIQVHSGDREPGSAVSEKGKRWLVAGLKLLANRKANRKQKKK